jgi:DNA-binding MarR family transcriptional regulator
MIRNKIVSTKTDGVPMLGSMAKRASAKSKKAREDGEGAFAGQLNPDADLTWLLHRAAQRMHSAMDEQAERHGIDARGYIVLSALAVRADLTQLELAKALGLDKTTLMFQLDGLESKGLVVRRADPRDRRSRIPEATAAGLATRAKVAAALSDVEGTLLSTFVSGEQRSLRLMLCKLIGVGEGEEDIKGSCL